MVVTGASHGVGRRSVELFLEQGARVVAADRLGAELSSAFQEAGDRVELVEADLVEVASCEAVVGAALRRFGRLDVLFNNAGITIRSAAEDTSDTLSELHHRHRPSKRLLLLPGRHPASEEPARRRHRQQRLDQRDSWQPRPRGVLGRKGGRRGHDPGTRGPSSLPLAFESMPFARGPLIRR